MVEMSRSTAREIWRALLNNASALIADVYALLAIDGVWACSFFTVLAQEELDIGTAASCGNRRRQRAADDDRQADAAKCSTHRSVAAISAYSVSSTRSGCHVRLGPYVLHCRDVTYRRAEPAAPAARHSVRS